MGAHDPHSPLPTHALEHAIGVSQVPSILHVCTPLPEHRLLAAMQATHWPFTVQRFGQGSLVLVTRSGPQVTDWVPLQILSAGIFPAHPATGSWQEPWFGPGVVSQSCCPAHGGKAVQTCVMGLQDSTPFWAWPEQAYALSGLQGVLATPIVP